MILDFDLTETRERPINAYNAPGSINSSLTISAPCGGLYAPSGRSGRFCHYLSSKKHAEHTYKYTLLMYNQCINV